MTAVATSRWSRRFVLAGAAFLVAWQLAALLGLGRRTGVALGLYGFVLHTVFGKAYSLVPTYFDRELATTRWLPAHFAATTAGATGMAAGTLPDTWHGLATIGVTLWALGVLPFVGVLAVTIGGNPTGRETGTSDANTERRRVDRLANPAMPVALAYLVLGAYVAASVRLPLPGVIGRWPAATHLLAAGTAALLVFGIGFRLLPRFLVAHPPRWFVVPVLAAGAIAPLPLAASLWGGPVFRAGAVLEAIAVTGYAVVIAVLLWRSDRRRVGFLGVAVGAVAGVLGVAIGLNFAFGGPAGGLVTAHYRLNLLGFLGLTIMGISYQFYPPGVAEFRGGGDRTAGGALLLFAVGLGVEVAGIAARDAVSTTAGRSMVFVGATVHAALLYGLFRQRYGG